MPKLNYKYIKIIFYVLLLIISVIWVEMNHLPLWVAVICAIPSILADLSSEYDPITLAYLYTHKKRVAYGQLIICVVTSCILYFSYPFHKEYPDLSLEEATMSISKFLIQGAIVGVIFRMLMLNLFADILRVRNMQKAKILIMTASLIFILMFPASNRHLSFAAFYTAGFGLGFLVHYLVRIQERKNTTSNRLKENLLEGIKEIKKRNGIDSDSEKTLELTDVEEMAVHLYSKQKWNLLKRLIQKNKETKTLFFIRICMLRKLHDYDLAISLIREKLENEENKDEHYLYLHYALNESERFDFEGNWEHEDRIFENLEKAYNLNPNCLLTGATYALRVAGEIDPLKEDEKTTVLKDKALQLMWKAMKIYEGNPKKQIVGLVTGMTIPVTYTFLLETYGYVLLKCGRPKFAKSLILQCLNQDPTFSATYLHLGEWYYYIYGQKTNIDDHKAEFWRRSSQLALYIAIEMEKRFDPESKGTLISTKAKKIMRKFSSKS